jgi:DNA-binding FadR family transcriptional regulator
LDARLTIEPALARRAALQASPQDIRKLQHILSRQRRGVERDGTAPEEDVRFHHTIALASKNYVMVRLLDVLIHMLRNTHARRPAGFEEVDGHERILAALVQHDAWEAERAMRRHLQQTQQRH